MAEVVVSLTYRIVCAGCGHLAGFTTQRWEAPRFRSVGRCPCGEFWQDTVGRHQASVRR